MILNNKFIKDLYLIIVVFLVSDKFSFTKKNNDATYIYTQLTITVINIVNNIVIIISISQL